MKLSKTLAAAVATSLVAAPVVAQASAAQVGQARVGSDVEGENLAGGFIIPLAVLVAIVLGILAATGDDDNDLPTSP